MASMKLLYLSMSMAATASIRIYLQASRYERITISADISEFIVDLAW